jgi:uncharacterized membrane protein
LSNRAALVALTLALLLPARAVAAEAVVLQEPAEGVAAVVAEEPAAVVVRELHKVVRPATQLHRPWQELPALPAQVALAVAEVVGLAEPVEEVVVAAAGPLRPLIARTVL